MTKRITLQSDTIAIARDPSRPGRADGLQSLRRACTQLCSSALALAMILLFHAPDAVAQDVETTTQVDVVFVLDNSGSMRENDPRFLTRKAVMNFASALAEDQTITGRIAVVLFDGKARLVRGLTELEPGRTDDLLEEALAELDFSGQRTNSPAGIERALYELSQNGRDGARSAIVLLSDGKIDTGDAQNDSEAARWLREDLAIESEASGIRIFGVAFTEAADYQLMQALASRTHARYYRAFEASQLTNVVEDVVARVTEESFYSLSLANSVALDAGQLGDLLESDLPASPPPVSAAPIDREGRPNIGLFALLPVALLLAGGALLWRQRSARSSVIAPSAQLLDVGGQLGTTGAVIELSGAITRIGRDPHNDIVLDDDTISSEHAVIEVSGGRYWIEDQKSTNGTRVGDERVEAGQRVQLKGGDHIRLSDIDLMFVLAGYMPGGATVFLSTPTGPPPAWNDAEPAEGTGSEAVDEKSPAAESVAGPDSVSDSVESPCESDAAAVDPAPEQERSDEPADNSVRRGQLSLLRTPEEEPEASRVASIDDREAFRRILDYHLKRVSEISPAFASFVDRAFDEELRSALVVTARDLTSKANEHDQIQQKEYTFDRIRFAICGVPGEMESASDRFVESFGGFTRMLSEQLQSESFRMDRCEILAVLSAGAGESPWVSLSIVPDEGQDPRIDLLSYEFLTTEERREIESNEHVEVSHSGIG